MAEFAQGDMAVWNSQPVKIDAVYRDGQTGQAFYQVSDPTGRLFRPAGYTFMGEAQLSSSSVMGYAASFPGSASYQRGYDVLVQLYPMGSFVRVTASFPVRHFFAYNPVTALRFVNDALVPVSRSFMSRQGTGEEVYEMGTIDLQEGDYLELRTSAVARVLFVLMNGELVECAREGDSVIGVYPAPLVSTL